VSVTLLCFASLLYLTALIPLPTPAQAMFEGILLELPLAGFFLKKFRAGAWCDVNDLPTLDAELYRNLLVLRDYGGDAADLALTFTVADSTLGAHREVRVWHSTVTPPLRHSVSMIRSLSRKECNRTVSNSWR
jgi:hypothetical protein